MGGTSSKTNKLVDDDGFATVTGRNSSTADDGFKVVTGKADNQLPKYSKPSLEKANEFYYSTLSRRFKDNKNETGFRLARLGELKSGDEYAQEYSMWTPDSAFSEFGIGVSLYFKTIKTLFLLIVACALISLVAIEENAKFNPDSSDSIASCNNDDCVQPTPSFLVGSVYGAVRADLLFNKQGAADIAICVILMLFALAASFLEDDAIEEADASQQTVQDYSIVIRNPPVNITDPKVYREKFKKFGEIVFVTLCRRNGALLKSLAEKKWIDSELSGLRARKRSADAKGNKFPLEKQADLSIFQRLAQQLLGMYYTIEYLEQALELVNQHNKGLAQEDFIPWRVFITFDTERAKAACLAATTMGVHEVWQNSQENQDAVLDGQCLKISSTSEASDIIWENSHFGYHHKIASWLISYFISCGIVVVAFFIVQTLAGSGSLGVAIFISILNGLLPYILKLLTLSVEIHTEKSSVERSLLFKLVVVRCINSGLLIYLAAHYDQTFRLSHLSSIQNILIFDAFLTPGLRALDLDGYFYRQVLARFARTQDEMNSYWQGTEWTLAERYTDMLKTFFVGMFFSVPLPSGLFITAIAMLTTYCADRYCLFRVWKRPALLDGSLSVVARYFFVISLWAHVSISRIYFANWPYRGVNNTDDGPIEQCNFLFRCDTNSLMTHDQSDLVELYTMACSVTFFIIILWVLYRNFGVYVRRILYGYENDNEAGDTGHRFSEMGGIDAFIPVLERYNLQDPLICVNVSGIPSEYLPIPRGYFDVMDDPQIFSICKHDELPFLNSADAVGLKSLFSEVLYTEPTPPVVSNLNSILGINHSQPTAATTTAPTNLLGIYMQNSHSNPLPQGWEIKRTAAGRLFYVDHNTQSTHWHLPTSGQTGGSSNSSSSGQSAASLYAHNSHAVVLPQGWERKMTDAGRIYYLDHSTQTSHWTLPTTAANVAPSSGAAAHNNL